MMSRKILFVDGDQPIMMAVNAMLKGMGHNVQMETSGVDALNAFMKNPASFDLIITDVGMPDISGLILAERLAKVRADIPVLLLTGIEGLAQSKARESGIRWFGMKPLSMTDLADTVEKALAGNSPEQ
jgi:DNA-binding NtrC family response regulator